jgi:putative cell wall-binding protein
MSSVSMSIENMNIMDMEVTDDRFPGITFTGTAQSVYEQMKALKPDAFSDDVDVVMVETRSLQKRSTVNLPSLTSFRQ